jgi:hypothetical protein
MRLFILLFCGFITFSARAGNNVLPACDFQRLFHKLANRVNTTTLRKELKIVVNENEANRFLQSIETILGDNSQPDPSKKRMTLRDTPPSSDEMYFTQTEYLPKFQGRDEEDRPMYNAVIRIRQYIVAPTKATSSEVAAHPKPQLQKMVDTPGEYAKLEIKMGHTQKNTEGVEVEIPGVVEKPTLTLLRSDIDLLLKDLPTYEKNKEAVIERSRNSTLTQANKTSQVNDPKELEEMIKRIGEIHKAGFSFEKLAPSYQTLYQRTARKIKFDNFEVQLTMDRDVRVKQHESSEVRSLSPESRIIELKIPVAFADLTDQELTEKGLSDLAQIRSLYNQLIPQPGTERGQGKKSLFKDRSTSKQNIR